MGLDLNSLLTYNGMTLEIVVWSMFLGIILGAFGIYYSKNFLGVFVRALLALKADSPEEAKTLAETGFTKNRSVRFALSHSMSFRRLICSEPISPDAEKFIITPKGKKKKRKFSLDELKFYIPPEHYIKADSIYNEDGSSLKIFFLTIVLFLLVAMASFKVVPSLIQMGTNFIDRYFSSGF